MNLDKIKREKTKEAEKLFKKLKIETKKQSTDLKIIRYFGYPLIHTEEREKQPLLTWPRFSDNCRASMNSQKPAT